MGGEICPQCMTPENPARCGDSTASLEVSALIIFFTLLTSIPRNSTGQEKPSTIPSSPPRDTNRSIHFSAVKTKVGREGNAPSLAPEGAGQAAKLCPPTSPLVSAGEHSLPKQTPRGRDRSCPQLVSAQNPAGAPEPNPCKLRAASPIPALALIFTGENAPNLSSKF